LIQAQAPAVLAGNTVTVFSMSSTTYFLKVQIQSGAYVLVASTNPGGITVGPQATPSTNQKLIVQCSPGFKLCTLGTY
jgi:hypothetical protein